MRYRLMIMAALLCSSCISGSSHSNTQVSGSSSIAATATSAATGSQTMTSVGSAATRTVSSSALGRSERTAVRQAGVPSSCPVTAPDQNAPGGAGDRYGEHGLETILWPDGVVAAGSEYVQPDGSIRMKFPWWREAGVVGQLTVTGKRLDGASAPLKSDIPPGYGQSGLQATYLIFPTEGCWRVTGKAGHTSLTFVTWVVKNSSTGTMDGP